MIFVANEALIGFQKRTNDLLSLLATGQAKPRPGEPKSGRKGFVSLLVSPSWQVADVPRLNQEFEPCTAHQL